MSENLKNTPSVLSVIKMHPICELMLGIRPSSVVLNVQNKAVYDKVYPFEKISLVHTRIGNRMK